MSDLLQNTSEKMNCTLCKKTFPTKAQVKRHIHLAHTSKREFQCSSCESRFPLRNQLTTHEKIHLEKDKVKCVICKKEMTERSLNAHYLTHRTDKQRCPYCQLSFSGLINLKSHLKGHVLRPWMTLGSL